MTSLSAEQLKKIEENRKKALMKKMGTMNQNQSKPNMFPVESQIIKDSSFYNTKSSKQQTLTCSLKVLSSGRIVADVPYNEPSIEMFKSISNRSYDNDTKKWNFPITEHDNLVKKLSNIPKMTINGVPRNVISTFSSPEPPLADSIELQKIDSKLLETLMPFQIEGIRFGISRKGRCLLADDMGLGKTLQALGIAHYYYEKWPMLIVCPSSMRFPWEDAIQRHCPSVNPYLVNVMTSGSDDIMDSKVVIISYDLLKTCLRQLLKKNFGVLIFDESHFLKSAKSARTNLASDLAVKAQHIILLSGTPALSRPQELYPQLHLIDPVYFKSFHEFGMRYCDARHTKFGWNYSGSSNLDELDLLLKRRFMIRRMKSDVLAQLPSKVRKLVYLHPTIVQRDYKKLQDCAKEMHRQSGIEKRGALLSYYYMTGSAKLPAVCEYLTEKLSSIPSNEKIIIFAHHAHVLDGLCEALEERHCMYMRIDGATSAESRASLCSAFQTDDNVKCAVLSIKAANAGITLTAAKFIIFAELYWNPGELTQAEDRAHRIGQKDHVIVEYLLAKGTADDYIWSLVQNKLNVLNQVGLSKDNFKNSKITQLAEEGQKTLDDYFTIKTIEGEDSDDCGAAIFNEVFGEDDDLFNNIDLSNIEGIESKRRKME